MQLLLTAIYFADLEKNALYKPLQIKWWDYEEVFVSLAKREEILFLSLLYYISSLVETCLKWGKGI